MTAVRKLRHLEFRAKLINTILGMLEDLPETHRNIFIWSHYGGYPARQIADILGWSSSHVEATLGGINSTLYQKARALLAEDLQFGRETSLGGAPQDMAAVTVRGLTLHVA
jgi:Sigma-70, region 4